MSTTQDVAARTDEKLDLVLRKIDQMNLQVEAAREIISAHSGELTERERARAKEFGLYAPRLSQGLSSWFRKTVRKIRER